MWKGPVKLVEIGTLLYPDSFVFGPLHIEKNKGFIKEL